MGSRLSISPRSLALASLLLSTGLQAAPPGPGNIQQQTLAPRALPQAPAQTIKLPTTKEEPVQSDVKIKINKLKLKGNQLFPTSVLAPVIAEFSGREVSLGELYAAAARISDYYHQHDYPLAYAFIPEQEVAQGVVILEIVEPRYDQVRFDNQSRLKASQAERTLGLKSGDYIKDSSLQRGMLLLNRTPGIQVQGSIIPGATPNTSSLETRLKDTKLFRSSFSLDNHGSRYTGRNRAQVNLALDNPSGYGDSIALNALTTEGRLLDSVGFNYLSPNLINGLRFNLYGSRVSYRLGQEFKPLKIDGSADQVGLSLNYPIILKAGTLLEGRLDLTHNDFTQDPNSHYQVDTGRLSLAGVRTDASGLISGGLSITRGEHNNIANPFADRHFWVTQLQLQRVQYLPKDFQLRIGLNGQAASTSLDGSQQFFLGGPNAIQAYEVGTLGGDEALMLNLGLHRDFSLGSAGRLTAGLILQSGKIQQLGTLLAGARRTEDASSAGFQLEYRANAHVQAKLDYAHRLGSKPKTLRKGHDDDMLWASLTFDF